MGKWGTWALVVALAAGNSGCIAALIGAGVAGAALGGGGRSQSTTIAHPLVTGTLAANQLEIGSGGMEQEYAIPQGTLSDRASMTELTNERVCFAVQLTQLEENAGRYVDLRNWTIVADTDDGELAPTEVQPSAASVQSYSGQRGREVQTGSSTECTSRDQYSNCNRWEERPTYSTVYDPATINVVTGGGQICMAHGGRITPATESIELELENVDGGSMSFEWELEPPAQQPVATR